MMGIHLLYLLEDAAPLVDQVCNNVTNTIFCSEEDRMYTCMLLLVYFTGENKPPPDLFTGWAQWTRCTRTCEGGTRARRRECALTPDGGFVDCRGETLQVETCNPQDCPSA